MDMFFIIPGRFQPWHKGHDRLLGLAFKLANPNDHVIVDVVYPPNRKRDLRNPFTLKTTVNLIERAVWGLNVDVVVTKTAWPGLVLDEIGYDPEQMIDQVVVVAGDDRSSYKSFERYGIEVIQERRANLDASGTQVRQAILEGDIAEYKRLVPSRLRSRPIFDHLRKELLEVVQ